MNCFHLGFVQNLGYWEIWCNCGRLNMYEHYWPGQVFSPVEPSQVCHPCSRSSDQQRSI